VSESYRWPRAVPVGRSFIGRPDAIKGGAMASTTAPAAHPAAAPTGESYLRRHVSMLWLVGIPIAMTASRVRAIRCDEMKVTQSDEASAAAPALTWTAVPN